jgi:hypothetical protein
MHLSKYYAGTLQPEAPPCPPVPDAPQAAAAPRTTLPASTQHAALYMSLIGQLVALTGWILLVSHAQWIAWPWWTGMGIISLIMLLLYFTNGLGKWEIALVLSLWRFTNAGGSPVHLEFLLLVFFSWMLSIACFFHCTRCGSFDDLNLAAKFLYLLMALLVFCEILLLFVGGLGILWLAIAWGSSSNFG